MKPHSFSFLFVVATLFALPTMSITGCSDNEATINPPPSHPTYDILAEWLPSGQEIIFWGSEPQVEEGNSGIMMHSLIDDSTSLLWPEVSPLEISITPDGEWITLYLVDGIYNRQLDGDSVVKLPLPADAYNVDWSPDGAWMAFDTPGGPDRGVYIQNVATGRVKKLRSYARDPRWFSDGMRLAVVTYEFGGGDSEVAVIDTSGDLLTRLTDDDLSAIDVDVSPDGNLVVMTMHKEGIIMNYVVSAEGGGVRLLSPIPGWYPAFSPDGNWITFTTLAGKGAGRIWKVRPDGTDLHRLTSSRQ